MSLCSWFTRNNLKNKETLAKYWNPIGFNCINKEEIREEKHIEPITSSSIIDDYGSSFLNTLEE